jgi:hypothetical protein
MVGLEISRPLPVKADWVSTTTKLEARKEMANRSEEIEVAPAPQPAMGKTCSL